jgi:hypothetical protein
MNRKVEAVARRVTDTVKNWAAVDTIALGDTIGDDPYDPYFFLSLDVYHLDHLPTVEQRIADLSYGGAFESSTANKKDRFFVDDVPVRLEYHNMARFEQLISGKEGLPALLRESGTYGFFRVMNAEILVKKTEWIYGIRKTLENLSPSFWNLARMSFQARMEHYLSDMGAAEMREDALFFLISSSGFVRSLCSVLFAINRQFEPSARLLGSRVPSLAVLPESFGARLETLLRTDADQTPARKRGVAELLAKSVLVL